MAKYWPNIPPEPPPNGFHQLVSPSNPSPTNHPSSSSNWHFYGYRYDPNEPHHEPNMELPVNNPLWSNWHCHHHTHPLWWTNQQWNQPLWIRINHLCFWHRLIPLQLQCNNVRNLLKAKWLFFDLGWKGNQILCPLLWILIMWTIQNKSTSKCCFSYCNK